MKTIKTFIDETIALREIDKQLDREDRKARIYTNFPELARIDEEIFDNRCDFLMRVIDEGGNAELEISKREEDAALRRRKYMIEHDIDELFDDIRPICEKCNDTGFVETNRMRVVCSCMREEIIKSYEEAGLGDYSRFTKARFDLKFIKASEARREAAYKSMARIIRDIPSGKEMGLFVYSDGVAMGKTYLCIVMLKTAIKCGLSAQYVKCERLMGAIDIDSYRSSNLLVIDDYSSSISREYKFANNLNSLLETRLNNNLATIIITNEIQSDLVNYSDERIAGKISRAIFI